MIGFFFFFFFLKHDMINKLGKERKKKAHLGKNNEPPLNAVDTPKVDWWPQFTSHMDHDEQTQSLCHFCDEVT